MTTTTSIDVASPALSRIRLDMRSPQARRDTANRDQMKKTLCTRLAGSSREDAALLWRWESSDGSPTILVQTCAPIDPSGLPDGYCVEFSGPVDIKAHLDSFDVGDEVMYRITVNAVRGSTRNQPGPKRRRVPRSELDQWWCDKAPRSTGLAPNPANVRSSARSERIPHTNLWIAEIAGTASVADPDRLREAIRKGVGHAKSFGCGLLTVTRAAPAAADLTAVD